MDDNRTMAQLLQAPTEGYEDAIVIPEINANFELKHSLINLVQNKTVFRDMDKEDPHFSLVLFFFKLHFNNEIPGRPEFYNALNANDQDSLNSAAGGNFLDKMPRECLRIIEKRKNLMRLMALPFDNKSPSARNRKSGRAELRNLWSTLLRNKEKLEEIAITTVNAECSAIFLNKVPEKLKDPGKFLISCALQELDRTNTLANSGASINLLPLSSI
ncbi:hypothetical protein Tco_0858089 [Tanacetum coccineum]|uniref:Reverse transcriptase domain-containing protein n=1 Tax=Tanacetum coccineum TaxID=301880 RepID=A0ABQ5BAV9_9ASTR